MNNTSPLLRFAASAFATASIISCDASFEAAVDENLFTTPEVSPASLVDDLEHSGCKPIEVTFPETRLFGKFGEVNSSPMVPVKIYPGMYHIHLRSKDIYHPAQDDQNFEQWLLVAAHDDYSYLTPKGVDDIGYDTSLFQLTEPTTDLPTHLVEETTVFENVYIDYPVSWLKAVHAYVSDYHNSIEPVYADFYPASDYCDLIWEDDYTGWLEGKFKGKGKGGKGKGGKDKDPKRPDDRDTEKPPVTITEILTELEATEEAVE